MSHPSWGLDQRKRKTSHLRPLLKEKQSVALGLGSRIGLPLLGPLLEEKHEVTLGASGGGVLDLPTQGGHYWWTIGALLLGLG